MPVTIYADSNDGWIRSRSAGRAYSWAVARDTGADAASSSDTRLANAVNTTYVTGRSGYYQVVRSWFGFDTSAITSTVEGAILYIYGFANGSADLIAVKGRAAPNSDGTTALTTSEWTQIEGYQAATSGEVWATKYSDEVSTWSTTGLNSITLNANALNDMRNDDYFRVCLMGYDFDFLNVAPPFALDISSGMYYEDVGTTSAQPQLVYAISEIDKIDDTSETNIKAWNKTLNANIANINLTKLQ